MKIKPYVTKLTGSKEFKDFQKEHKDAFMAAGFFVIDFETGKNVHQLDYYIPSQNKIAAFTLDHKIIVQMLTLVNEKMPGRLDSEVSTDLDTLKGILEDEMKNRGITEDIKKIIAILQNIDGKNIWNLNCVLSGMDILKAHVDDKSQTILKMDKSSIYDYIKKVNPKDLMKAPKKPQTKQDTEAEIKKLDALAKEIEKEKADLKKNMPKK
jgi:hypothetical protein